MSKEIQILQQARKLPGIHEKEDAPWKRCPFSRAEGEQDHRWL